RYGRAKVPASPAVSPAQVFHHGLLFAGELYAPGLALALEHVHGIVVLDQQGLDPASMRVHLTITLLLLQGLLHDRGQALITLAAQAACDVGQTFEQARGECNETRCLTLSRNELGTKPHH